MTSRVHRLLADDVDAGFEELVRQQAGAVLTLARRICGSAGDDVAQDAFLRALRSLRTMPTEAVARLELRPWILTITRHTAYNHHRTRSRRPQVVGEPTTEAAAQTEPPEATVERRETAAALQDALARLPAVQRDAIVLRHVLDLSSREAAAVLGCNENTLKSHLSRGLHRVRADVDHPDPEEDPR